MTTVEMHKRIARDTLVFETLGRPDAEREFSFKTLRRWGLDLLAARRDGQDVFFLCEAGRHQADDIFEDGGVRYEVEAVLTALPEGKRLFARISLVEGTAFLQGTLREGTGDIGLVRLPAASLLMVYAHKHRLPHLGAAVRSVGTATELVKQRGQEGNPFPFDRLPNMPRRFLREAHRIEKEMGFGRIALAYFGENKDKDARFRVSWLVPTIALFEPGIAEKIDNLLAAFK